MDNRDKWVYVTCLCEGPNDALLLKKMESFFATFHLRMRTRVQVGIDSLVMNCSRLVRKFHVNGPVLMFFDEADLKQGDMDKLEKAASSFYPAMTVPVVRKIEAWLMADTLAFSRAMGTGYGGPVPTDVIEDPKKFFIHSFRVAVRQKKRGFLSRETDFFRAVTWRWDLERARQNNLSLEGFCSSFKAKMNGDWN